MARSGTPRSTAPRDDDLASPSTSPAMPLSTDIRPVAASLYLLPVRTRMPLKFGPETLTEVTYARVKLTVESRRGHRADRWGETPLSVQWGWPSALPFAERRDAMIAFC